MDIPSAPVWALVLAGGDGIRLRSLTARIIGDYRPKQFCPLFGRETLLDRTLRRIDLLVRFDRQVVAVSRPHETYYAYLQRKLMPGRLVVQPENRDTGPAILYSLLRVLDLAGDVPVAVFPSDHYVADDRAFMECAKKALEVVRARPDLVVLLGIEPSYPETDYGWIEPAGVPLPIGGNVVFPIRGFWEKPSASLAHHLMRRGALWNSFVMAGWLSTFLALIEAAAPDLTRAFEPVRVTLASRDESAALERVYAMLPSMSFSHRVLTRASRHMVTMPAPGVEWSDWGRPKRVFACLHRAGAQPPWLTRLAMAN